MIWRYVGVFLSEIQRQQLYDRYFFLGIIFIAFTILIIIILAPHAKEKWITGILNWMQKLQKYVPAVTENEPKNLKKTSQVKLYMFSCRSSICIILFFILKKIEFKLPLNMKSNQNNTKNTVLFVFKSLKMCQHHWHVQA